MKSYKNKIFAICCAALALGASSCVGDLDLKPNDPNTTVAGNLTDEQIEQVMAKCYSGIAVSGQGGPDGSSDIAGLDGGTSQYTRALFMLNEFTTDETNWIWADEGVFDLVTDTWSKGNANIFGTYSRMYVHIAICNDFLRAVADIDNPTVNQYKLEARALRALSYYNIIDLFGNGGFLDETSKAGDKPVQQSRAQLYTWLKGELETLVAAFPDTTPHFGRVGKDGVEALLARLYLNGKVFADDAEGYTKCAEHCENIIARHKGSGYNGSGLVPFYMYVFSGNNDTYMPGGGGVNEILWGVPYDANQTQPYGGTTFLVAAPLSNLTREDNNAYMNSNDYGSSANWGCMHATPQLADKFTGDDDRWSMWLKEENGFSKENTSFSKFTDGYGVIKFTNLIHGDDNTFSMTTTDENNTKFPNTDLPLIRLADVYLMYAECNIVGKVGDAAKALEYVNYVRGRAGNVARANGKVAPALWTADDMTADNLLDERSRELYWENTRRTDLVRFNKFTGGNYVWSFKGASSTNDGAGKSIPDYMNLFPIPTNVIAAQPEFNQNPGY